MGNHSSSVFRRIIAYLKPYKAAVIPALAALIIATAAELALPFILQRAVDRTILREYRRIDLPTEDDPAVQTLLKEDEGIPLEQSRYIHRDALSVIPSDEISRLMKEKKLDPDTWYVFPSDQQIISRLSEKGLRLTLDGSYGVVRTSELQTLSEEDLSLLKESDRRDLKRLAWFFFLVLFAGLLASFYQVYLMAFTGQSVMIDMRMGLFAHLLGQSLGFLTKKPVGSLVTRATNDVETVNDLFAQVATSLLKDLTVMVGVLSALFLLNRRLAFITCLSLPPVILFTLIFRVKAREAYRRVRKKVSALNTFLSEHLAGMEVVQMFAVEDDCYNDFSESNKDLLKANLSEMYVFAAFRPLVDLLASVSIGVVLYWGSSMFLKASLSLGVLIAFINLVEKFYQPLKDISEQFSIMQSALAGGERVFQTLDEDEKIPPGEEFLEPLPLQGEVVLDHVSFAYNPGEPVLKDISFHVSPGETVALVGYTGAGKTTVANLLTRLWEIDEGTISLDGRNIRNFTLSSLREAVLPVDQDVFLFQGTIRDNISLGKELSDEEVQSAAEAVFLHDYIVSLPKGYDTPLSEGGTNLSTGQRQLLSFARVVAHNPRIIILDEATASIDTHTEALVQAAMKRVLQNRTSIVIAHRLSTIRDADRIYVLSGGTLAEQGSHGELMEKKGVYYNLYRLQYRFADRG
ncbi:MAG: ABC transporter ATP-binding protein [Spirochaetales bacterium]|nr:ABC transporter ATP-binding protein [Spirochaetales bacterium]